MQVIVIATTPSTSEPLSNLLNSMRGYDKYPIVILSDYSFEVGKINFVKENMPNIDEFVLLHDTCEVKNTKLFDLAFCNPLSVSFSASPQPFGAYLGKYQKKVLDLISIPSAKTKLDSVNFEETFNTEYIIKAKQIDTISNPLINRDVFVQKFGKRCMKLENEYLIKYKSYWSRSQVY